MKRLRPSLRLKFLRDAYLVGYARSKVNRLTDNPNYPVLFPLRDEVELKANEFESAIVATGNGGKHATLVKQQARKALHNALTRLASKCVEIANGDGAIFLSSGFNLRKRSPLVGLLPAPRNFRAEHASSEGDILLRWKAMFKANSFVIEYTANPDAATGWVIAAFSTKSKSLIKELKLGQRYWFRVAAVNAAGRGPWSNPATRIAA